MFEVWCLESDQLDEINFQALILHHIVSFYNVPFFHSWSFTLFIWCEDVTLLTFYIYLCWFRLLVCSLIAVSKKYLYELEFLVQEIKFDIFFAASFGV